MREKSLDVARLSSRAVVCFSLLALGVLSVHAQTVTNVRAQQLANKTVEVLYDLSGVASGGATVAVAFSRTGAAPYDVVPTPPNLSGDVGSGINNGVNRRIVWNSIADLPAGTYEESWKAAVTAGQEITIRLPGGVTLEMAKVPAGTFQMGSPTTEKYRSDDEILHQVTLRSDYFMGKHEVTQGQWKALMGSNPSSNTACGDNCPVEQVSLNNIKEANGFIAKLNAHMMSTGQTGVMKFRLSTEAEWERAARGGTQARFFFGEVPSFDYGCGPNGEVDPYMWWCGNFGNHLHPVGMKEANQYGLYDMLGNAWEWVEDWYGPYPSSPQTDPIGPNLGTERQARGGACPYLDCARSAFRTHDPSFNSGAFYYIGFRLAGSLAATDANAEPGSSSLFTIDLRACSYSLNPPGPVEIAAAGAAGRTFQVQTDASCPWTARVDVRWIQITAGTSGTGNGIVTYSVDANTSTSARSGVITAGGQSLTVNQLAFSGPVLSVTPSSLEFRASPSAPVSTVSQLSLRNLGAGIFSWTLSADVAWLRLSTKTGTGDSNVSVSADGTGLAAGWYTGTLTVTATGAQQSPQKIPIRLAVVRPILLSGGHVAVDVSWRSQYNGDAGMATPIPQGDGFAYFYFFDPNNPEVFVKVLDFGASSPYLVFYAGLTDFEYSVTFTNVTTLKKLTFTKPAGSYSGGANNQDLPHGIAHAAYWSRDGEWSEELKGARTILATGTAEFLTSVSGNAKSPAAANELLLSKGRIAVSVNWRSQYDGQTGQAAPLPQKDEFGFFYFFDANNPEVFVKVLDFGQESPYLIFYAGLTDFEYTVNFRNVQTGQNLPFKKEAGTFNGGADNTSLKH